MEWYHIVAIISAVVLVIAIVVLIVLLKKKKNKVIDEFPNLLLALGGKENITSVSYKGSRVSALIGDKKIINKELIKEQGVETIVISNKKVTMVVGKKSEEIFNYLNNQINM